MADSRQERPGDSDRGSPSPWAPPPQVQPHEAADHAGAPPSATWPPEQTWQPEEVLTGEIEPGPTAQETDIYGNPVPGHYRTGARYADADAAVDNDHFSAGRTIWSEPQPRWAPEQPPPASFGSETSPAPPAPSGSGSGSPPIRPTLSSSLRPRGPVDATPSPSSGFTPPASPTSAFIPTQRTGDAIASQPPLPRGGSGQNDHYVPDAAPTNNGPS